MTWRNIGKNADKSEVITVDLEKEHGIMNAASAPDGLVASTGLLEPVGADDEDWLKPGWVVPGGRRRVAKS
ncbi:hypothetical protein EP7_002268 [Isosphaeraceae bacterium EP7]